MTDSNDVFFQPGDILFDTNEPSRNAYFIMEGSVELQLTLGNRSLKFNTGPNQFIGDAAVVITEKSTEKTIAYHGRATAIEPTRAVAISHAEIKQELESCSPLLKAWFSSFISRVLIVIEKLSKD